ncbi:MAG: thioredoxin family protein [Melioribacteraceae bacterium]|nr:thioredoxin family protein [Melioribacteraceae bacterium]
MKFDLVVTENCRTCKSVEEILKDYFTNKKSVSFNVLLHNNFEKNVAIVPALFMEGKLFAYGDVDLQKLDDIIKGVLN